MCRVITERSFPNNKEISFCRNQIVSLLIVIFNSISSNNVDAKTELLIATEFDNFEQFTVGDTLQFVRI